MIIDEDFVKPQSGRGSCGISGMEGKYWFTTVGYVKPGAFNLKIVAHDEENDDEEKVGLIFINPEKLYERYLKGSRAEYAELLETKSYLKC